MRGTLGLIITILLFFPHAAVAGDIFSDVGAGSSFYVPLKYLKEKGFINAYQPENLMTRASALKLIVKISGKEKKMRLSHPKRYINVAEMLRMLFKNENIETTLDTAPMPVGIAEKAWYAKDIAYAVSRNLIMQTTQGKIISPAHKLTRGEAAIVLYRYLKTKEKSAFGYASWYGDGLAKTKIPSGTELKEKNLTAAHLTLPFGTIVQVTNMYNGKTVDVVINDRGPFVTGRIIDLSKTAFSALASPGAGVIQVEMTVKK